MKKKLVKYLSAFFIFSLLIGGGLSIGGGEVFAKSVIRSNDYDRNKITGTKKDPYNYKYFSVPDDAYLSKTTTTKVSSGILYDTYRTYWVYYSPSKGQYYP